MGCLFVMNADVLFHFQGMPYKNEAGLFDFIALHIGSIDSFQQPLERGWGAR